MYPAIGSPRQPFRNVMAIFQHSMICRHLAGHDVQDRVLKSFKETKRESAIGRLPFLVVQPSWLENKVEAQDHIDPVTAFAGVGRSIIFAAACGNLGGCRSVSDIIMLHRQMQ